MADAPVDAQAGRADDNAVQSSASSVAEPGLREHRSSSGVIMGRVSGMSVSGAVRAASVFLLQRQVVRGCLKPRKRPTDRVFARAFDHSLAALEPGERRGALAGVTGHVAESVVEILLAEHGWIPVWHFVGPGRHGVDLLLLGPGAERLVAVEVKGTLRPRRWPRVRRGELMQMDLAWLDKSDNPAMEEWGVQAADVYGGVFVLNFAELAYKAALTRDFERWQPLVVAEQLDDLSWLDG